VSNPTSDQARGPLRGGLLDRFEIIRVLGAGATSKVYLAHQRSLDREVVLKVLDLPEKVLEESRGRFERECAVLAELRHTNVVELLDHGVDHEQLYLVYPASGGLALDRWVKENGAPSPLEIAGWLRDLLRGLEVAHDAGVIHRDIKPGNLLLLPDGTAQLMDFGLATQVGRERLTKTGVWVGTPAYAAPEQIHGHGMGPRADLYSLGVVAYQMLTGVQPFLGTFAEVVQRQLEYRPPPVAKVVPEVPLAFSDLVMQMLEKDPEDRPDDARAARLWIERVLAAMRSGAHPEVPGGKPRRAETRALEAPVSSRTAAQPALRTGPEASPRVRGRWRSLVLRLGVTLAIAGLVGTLMVRRPGAAPAGTSTSTRWEELAARLRAEVGAPLEKEARDPLAWEATLRQFPAVEELRREGEAWARAEALPPNVRELAEIGRSFSRAELPDPVAPYLEVPGLPRAVPLEERERRLLSRLGVDVLGYRPTGPAREVVYLARRVRRDLLRLQGQLFDELPITDPLVESFRREEMGLAGQLIREENLRRIDFVLEFRMGRVRLGRILAGGATPHLWRAVQRTRQLVAIGEPDADVAWGVAIDLVVRERAGLYGGLGYLDVERLLGARSTDPRLRFLEALLLRYMRIPWGAAGEEWFPFVERSNGIVRDLGTWYEERRGVLGPYVSEELPPEE
jgi:tRNA A-37 threonylcarbamoyl transferase component Bud32